MKAAAHALARALGATVSPRLEASLTVLEATAWHEVGVTWSRLTPSGFPVEMTIGPTDSDIRWTAEVAGPEVAEADRLQIATARMADAGCAVDANLVTALGRLQAGCSLRFGAWIGGRATPTGSEALKIYVEIPDRCDLAALGLPREIRSAVGALPAGTMTRMLGIDPARQRSELYLRLPLCEPSDLGGFLYGAGVLDALDIIDEYQPSGRNRLRARRLGVNIAHRPDGGPEVAVFVSATACFPVNPSCSPTWHPLWQDSMTTAGSDP